MCYKLLFCSYSLRLHFFGKLQLLKATSHFGEWLFRFFGILNFFFILLYGEIQLQDLGYNFCAILKCLLQFYQTVSTFFYNKKFWKFVLN